MINETTALIMLDGEVPQSNDLHHTNDYYKSVQAFADASVRLCDERRFKKLEQFLIVAWKLFKEGNATVKNGICNVYLYTLARVMDQRREVRINIEPLMPTELRLEYAKLHYISGI
jgi:hypothetical protein